MAETNDQSGKSKPYKWIKSQIEAADPYKDYEMIWRLSIEYTGGGDFMQNMIYALTFSNFIASEWGSKVVWREGAGKVVKGSTSRVYETQYLLYHNSLWWYYGPSHPETRTSIDIINKRHEYYAKKFPTFFSHALDYMYVLCFSAISVDRFRKRLRLQGFTEKQKAAAHIFWREMSHLFLVEDAAGGEGQPLENWKHLTGFPEDWDGMCRLCEEVERNHMVVTNEGHMISEALFDQFAYRYFPPSLRHLGRALPITLSLPETLKAHQIKPTNPVVGRIIIFVLGLFIWLSETFLPDPQVSYQESLRSRTSAHAQEKRRLDSGFPRYFDQYHQGAVSGCPLSLPIEKQD